MIKIWMHSMFLEGSTREESSLQFESDSEIRLCDLLNKFCKDDENLYFKLVDEQKNLRPHVNIFIGSTNCRNLKGIDSIVTKNDEVSVFPSLSGG